MSSHDFNEDYFIRGTVLRLSLYSNYRWLPHVSLPIANMVKKMYPDDVVLDYGCAMGFLVHALRLLDVTAYGYDISDYALDNVKEEVVDHVFNNLDEVPPVDLVFGKDVLEHCAYELLEDELVRISDICAEACFIIPLGDNKEYRIKEYGFDKTHNIIENEEWWIKQFINAGFTVRSFHHNIDGFKNHWYNVNPYGNGIFCLER